MTQAQWQGKPRTPTFRLDAALEQLVKLECEQQERETGIRPTKASMIRALVREAIQGRINRSARRKGGQQR